MGSESSRDNYTPHKVTLTNSFYIGVHEVTNAQWEQVMGRNVRSSEASSSQPVTGVNWEDAIEFCRRLSTHSAEQAAGRTYRLPTEAEWEYACRAGTTTQYSFGDNESELGTYGWFNGNSGSQTHPVGQKKPNGWGLYDMHGNVLEWCNDWFIAYPQGATTNPGGPAAGPGRTARGGNYMHKSDVCGSAHRNWFLMSYRYSGLGFRVALSPSGASLQKAETSLEQRLEATPFVASQPEADAEKIGQRHLNAAPGMVCPGLGNKCNHFSGDWSGTWVRRGISNIFDCTMVHGPARETATYVVSLEVKGENVIVRRTQYKSTIYGVRPPEQSDEYIWHFGKDGKSLYDKDPTYSVLVRAE